MISMTWPQYLRCQCTVAGQVVTLTRMEIEILLFLALRPGWVSRDEMVEFIYPDPDLEPEWAVNNMSVYIYRMRCRFGYHFIESQPCYGYRLARTQSLNIAA